MTQPDSCVSVKPGGGDDPDQDGHDAQLGRNDDDPEHQGAVLKDADAYHVFSNLQRHPDNIHQ